MDTSSRLVR